MDRGAFFQDPDFQDELIKFLVHDRNFLRDFSIVLSPEDFGRTNQVETDEQRLVAETALSYWRLYREPIGRLIRSEVLAVLDTKQGMNSERRQRLDIYLKNKILSSTGLKAAASIGNRVLQFKKEKAKAKAIADMQYMAETGALTDEVWIKKCQEGMAFYDPKFRVSDFWDELEKRISRRGIQYKRLRYPFLLIEPFDNLVRAISRGHIGCAMAPWKRGKSLFLQWVAFAYLLQGLKGAYWTLEDTLDDVEDRFDACVACLPIKSLHESDDQLRQRFAQVRKSIRTKLRIYDGTDRKHSIADMEDVFERERNTGFTPDFQIVDYDDEVKPPDLKRDKHEQQSDIYSEYRGFLGRHQLFGWIASQTGRDTQKLKIIAGSKIADAIGKVRKAHLVLGLGQGEWGDSSIYMYVDSHRSDKQHVGCNIMTKKEQMTFYDRDATMAMIAKTTSEEV